MAGLCVRLAALLCCAALPGGGAAQRQAAFSLDHTHTALEISEAVDSSQDYEVYHISEFHNYNVMTFPFF